MPFDADLAVNQLVAVYRAAYLELLQVIATKEARGNSTTFQRTLLADVNRILLDLDDAARAWCEQVVPTVYHGSADLVYEAWLAASATPPPLQMGFASVHKSAVELLTMNTYDNLHNAHLYVGRRIKDQWRKVSLEAILQKTTTGQTVKQAQKNLVRMTTEQGLDAFKDAKDRTWRLDRYAEMVARTTTREATNLGTTNQLQGMGQDLVQITSHAASCPVCAPYEGRIYSISGKTEGYPPLSVVPGFSAGYQTIHPNCRHVVSPYVRRFDTNADANQAASNKPFTDTRTAEQRERYEAEQERNRQRNDTRRQYESYRAWLPDDAPKSLAGFSRMKAANSKRYQELQALYRQARATAKGGT